MTSLSTTTFRRDRGRDARPKIDVAELFSRLPPHALEAEAALLGSIILDWRVAGDVIQHLHGPEDFYKPAHAALYETLLELYDRHQSIDLVQLNQKLIDKGMLDQVGGLEYLVELAEGVPSAASANHYARLVREKAMVRRLIEIAGDVLHACYHADEPAQELLDQAERRIFEVAEGRGDGEPQSLQSLVHETLEVIQNAQDGRIMTGVETGFFELDEMTNGLQPGEMIVIAARPSMGKAQPLDAKVLTTSGFVMMGELRVGDELASIDGRPSRVSGVFPQGKRQVYRVWFSDGRSAECCAEHLWRVHCRHWGEPRVLSTASLRELLQRKRYQRRVWIEAFTGEYGDDPPEGHGVDPWLLGLLLGDGTLSGSSVRFSSAEGSVVEAVRDRVAADGLRVNPAGGYDYRIAQADGAHRPGVVGVHPNPIKEALEAFGVWGCGADTKFIPETYFVASRQARLQLLAGLIDSDGWVESWGSVRFATSSRTLADDVVRLTRSLGGSARRTRKRTTYTYAGARREGLPTYVCNLQLPDPRELPLVSSKSRRLEPGRRRRKRLNIVSIEPTRVTDTQCIAVTHPSRLYVTDHYVTTHNTAFALNVAEHMALELKKPVAVFSLEMGRQQLAQRLLCSKSGVDSHKVRRNLLAQSDLAELQYASVALSEAPMFIDDTPGLSLLSLRAKARRLAARHGVQAVMIDYLQLMSAPGTESRQQEVSLLSRGIKALARELSVPVICLSQLNRQAEAREGHRPRLSDLRESGSIEQDADVVMMLHREDYYHRGDEDYVDTNIAEVILAKQRNGPTGTVKLTFHGGTTRFHNLARGEY